MAPIVFLHTLSNQEQQDWLTHLKAALPNETIVLPQELNPLEFAAVTLAIVANPNVEELKLFPNLVWIHSLWAGVESLVNSLATMQTQGRNNPVQLVRLVDPQLAATMAEAVLAWTLYLHRRMPEYAQQQRRQHWAALETPTATNVRVSVMGTGALGQAAIQRLAAMGYQVNGWSRSEKRLENATHYHGEAGLNAMLKLTDIVVCLLPSTALTYHILNSERLCLLPQGARLINFGRGTLIDEGALLNLLNIGHLSHAVLDVFSQEPLPVSSELWRHEKITVLPHISAPTNFKTASAIIAKNIQRYRQDGSLPQVVDLLKGY